MGRIGVMDMVSQYAGRYFSMYYIKRVVLQLTDAEITQMQKEIDAEVKDERVAKDATVEWGAAGPGVMGAPDGEIPGEGPAGTSYEQPPEEELPVNGTQPAVNAEEIENININKLFDARRV